MIKRVKASGGLWCCTKITKLKDKIVQVQTWHNSKKEAQDEDTKE